MILELVEIALSKLAPRSELPPILPDPIINILHAVLR
jgi:hypothetical protein